MSETARNKWGFDGYIISDCGALDASEICVYIAPAGKMPNTIYDVSLTENRSIGDMGLRDKQVITYTYYTGIPVYPFGFGLSYTTFKFLVINIIIQRNLIVFIQARLE